MSPTERFYETLDLHGCKPNWQPGGKLKAQCPACRSHYGLTANEGEDGRVLLKCWGGCSGDRVIEALGLQWRDLYGAR